MVNCAKMMDILQNCPTDRTPNKPLISEIITLSVLEIKRFKSETLPFCGCFKHIKEIHIIPIWLTDKTK